MAHSTGGNLGMVSPITNAHTLQIQNDIEKYIKAEAFLEQFRIKDFFEDYDKLRKGYVTEDKFRSGLSQLKLHLVEEQISALISKYRIPNSDLIDYLTFCDSVEKQFYDVPTAKTNLSDIKSKSVYSHQEETLLQSILNHLRREIRTRRILVKPSFQDFDRINVQHVTYEQFTRALTKLGLNIPDVCFKILARKYMDKNNTREINYEGFLKDVDYEHAMDIKGTILPVDVQNPIPLPAPHTSFGVDQVYGDHTVAPVSRRAESGLTESQLKRQHDENAIRFTKPTDKDFRPAGLEAGGESKNKVPLSFSALGNSQLKVAGDIDALEDKIRAHVVMYKIRVEQFFVDFDKLRKGTVSRDQFRRILKLSGIDLEDYQYELLVKKYSLDNTTNMDWFTFCKNIDKVFTTRGIEKNPLYPVPPIGSDSTVPARRHYLKLNEDEREKLVQILRLIRHEIQTRRILFKKHFQDFDVVHNGFVSRSQFLRVLSLFDIYPQEELLNVLLKCYTDNSNLNEVNYFEFCKDVDGQDDVTQSINNLHASRFSQIPEPKNTNPYIYKDTNQPVEEVIGRIQQKVKEERIRLREFLRDFDRLRSGNITNSQFRIGLNMAKLPLSNSDFTAITEHFRVIGKPGHMRWCDFCDVVDQVFNLKNLEMNPDATAQTLSLNNKTPRELMGPFDQELARKVVDRFKFFTQATRLYIKQFFQDWDRLGRNKVSPKQFRQVLATVKFNITDAEHKAITQYYLCADGNMNYVEFIKDTTPESMVISNAPVEATSQLAKTGLNSLSNTGAGGFQFESQVVGQNSAAPGGSHAAAAPNYSYMPDLEVDPMKVLERIKRDVRINRTRLREYLQDFDGLRKGNMTVNKFFGSIDKLKIQLTANEAKAIERIYKDPTDPDKIEYVRFVNDVDLVFATPGLEKNPLHRVNPYKIPTFLDPKDRLSQVEVQRLHELLVEIGNYVRVNRILIKPFFKDKDKAHSGKINFQRFRAIMDTCNIPITDEAFHLLSKRFNYQDIEFDYVEFDEVLKKYSDLGF